MKMNIGRMFFVPFVVMVPLIIWGALRNTLIRSIGSAWWGRGMTFLVVAAIVLTILPFLLVLRGIYKGGAINTFWGKGKEALEILKSGFPARATVIGIGETSQGTVTINEQPYLNLRLRVEDGYKSPYDVSLDTMVPRAAIPQFQPGAVFAVKVDRANPQNIVYDPEETAKISGPGSPGGKPTVGGQDWTDLDDSLLAQEGKDGLARILSVEETGRSRDFDPVVRLRYEVFVPREEPYTFAKEVPIPSQYARQLRSVVGRSFPARVHPHDRTKIKVDITF